MNGTQNSKRGCKPAGESHCIELRQRIREWKSAPPDQRQPPTLTQLAEELGISHQLASYYATPLPTPEERLGRLMAELYYEVYCHGTDRQRRQVARQVLQILKDSPPDDHL